TSARTSLASSSASTSSRWASPKPYGSVTSGPGGIGVVEVLVRPGRRGTALALIAGTLRSGPVGPFGRRAETEEAQLPDLHPGIELDRQGGDVGELQGDVSFETGVDESGGGVREQPQTPQGRLALQPGGDALREPDAFQGGAQDEFTRMQDEGL